VQTKQNFDLTNKHYAKEIDTLKINFLKLHSGFVYLISFEFYIIFNYI